MLAYVKKLLYRAPVAAPPSLNETERRAELAATLEGTVIFDSNREGAFSIFEVNLADGATKLLVKGNNHAMYPDVCPRTGAIVFTQAESTSRTAPANIWLLKNSTDTPEQIALNGTFPTFSADGNHIFFERGRKQLISYNLETGSETLVFPTAHSDFGDFAVVKPRVSPDQHWVLFTSDKAGRWNSWCANLTSGECHHVVKGCEGTWFPDSTHAAWIKKYGLLGNVGVYTVNAINPGAIELLQDGSAPYGHEYFPWITTNGSHLLYSACPNYEHDHFSAQYQLFAKDIRTGIITRISYDECTNRWPKVRPFAASANR